MTRPILPYERAPLDLQEWDPATPIVAARVAALIHERRPDLLVDHIGSSAVPGLPGKNVVDLGIETEPDDVPAVAELLTALGFQRQHGPLAFPPTRPMLMGSIQHEGRRHLIHAHVKPRGHRVWGSDHARDLAFRDALRADAQLRAEYAARKRAIAAAGIEDTYRYSLAKTEWIRAAFERLGIADPPILPPASIGILGGGQLGRMLAIAARQLGYRVAVLDPDPACPAAAVSDEVVQGAYDDVEAGLVLAAVADVVTVELEHVGLRVVEALDHEWPVRPGVWGMHVTQNRVEERRFVESEGIGVAPWREVGTPDEVRDAAETLGLPLRLKSATGGYDGRRQVVVRSRDDLENALDRLGLAPEASVVAERELEFAAELSVVATRGIDGRAATFPVARNMHDRGILADSAAPAPVDPVTAEQAAAIAIRLAEGLDLVGTLTVELFLMRDGSLLVNELAPRVHNSGHWTIEGCETSQFEQHIRAICGLPLGSTALRAGGAATVNLLGTGDERLAHVTGVDAALRGRDVHVHLYDKRHVFERRKMGHVTAVGASAEAALAAGTAAAGEIGWEA